MGLWTVGGKRGKCDCVHSEPTVSCFPQQLANQPGQAGPASYCTHSCRLVCNSWGVARPCGFSTPSSRLHPKPTLLGLSWEQAGMWVSVNTFIHGNTFAIVYQDEVRIRSCLKFAYVAITAWLLKQPTRGPFSWALVGVIDFTAFSILQGLFNLTLCRPHLLAILQRGYTALYNDVGMVWLADPFPLFEGHHDIFRSGDLAVVILGLTFACCSGQWLWTA
jgi:hypothetical protein